MQEKNQKPNRKKKTNGTAATILVTTYNRFVLQKKLIVKIKQNHRTNEAKFVFFC